QGGGSARLALTFFGSVALPDDHDEELAIESTIAGPREVAVVARWHEVAQNLTQSIITKMIDDEATLGGPSIGPVHSLLTPVTGMRCRSDGVVQNYSMFRDLPRWRAQRMVLALNVLVPHDPRRYHVECPKGE